MSNALRTRIQTRLAVTAQKLCQKFGDSITYTNGSGSSVSIYAIGTEASLKTFGPDEERKKVLIPYQTGFTSAPDSGARLVINGTNYIFETVTPDDAVYPITWECEIFRWMHQTAEVDG